MPTDIPSEPPPAPATRPHPTRAPSPRRAGTPFRVVVLDDYQSVAAGAGAWETLPARVSVEFVSRHLEGDALVSALAGADGVVLMRERTPLNRGLLEQLPRLAIIITTGPSNASIDVAAAADAGILVCGTRSELCSTVEMTWALILATTRRIAQEDRAVRSGNWQTGVGMTLRGRQLGIVGLGRIGSQVASIGHAFAMRLVAWSPNLTVEAAERAGAALVSKEDLFRESDVVTVHLREGPRSRRVVDARALSVMKASAHLINTSRGSIVDEEALVRCLADGHLAGVALDAYEREPLPLDHPLRRFDRVTLSPHMGYVADTTYAIFFEDVIEGLRAYLDADPIRVIAP